MRSDPRLQRTFFYTKISGMKKIRKSRYSYRRPPEPEQFDPAPPRNGRERYFYLLKNYWWKLIGLNLIYTVFCIPMFTIPAATAGLMRVLTELWTKGYSFFWDDFIDEFKQEFPLRMLLWFGLQCVPVLLWFVGNKTGSIMIAFWMPLLLEVLFLLFDAYWFPQLAHLTASSLTSFKNAWLLIFINAKETGLLVLISAFFYGAAYLLAPVSYILAAFCGFILEKLAICAIVMPVITKYLVKPEQEVPASQALSADGDSSSSGEA